ncbi:MAG: glycosyltransferase family 4 protein [bacterium]
MKIVINGLSWSSLIKGVDRYLIELIRHLALADRQNEYYIFHGQWQKKILPSVQQKNFKFICIKWVTNRIFRHIWHAFIFPFLAYRLKPDIIHLPNTLPLFFRIGNVVSTIHDQLLEFSYVPKYGKFRSLCRRITVKFQIKKSAHIIAVSDLVMDALLNRLNVNPSIISVIPNGVNTNHFNIKNRKQPLSEIIKPYILFVSVIDKNKNLDTLVRAYNMLPDSLKDKYLLIVVGKLGNAYKEVQSLVEKLKINKKIIFLGHITEKLPLIYSHSSVFVMPSWFEGFSLPILEAMASGVPVIASDKIAVADYLKRDIMTFNPSNPNELKDKIEYLLTNKDYAEEMSKKGIMLAQKFSWFNVAKETLKIYKQVVSPK